MKKYRKRTYVILVSLALLLILSYLSPRVRIDGLFGELSNLILSSDTEYAEGYSHKAFSQVSSGMTEKEVVDLLGEPFSVWQPYKYGNSPEKKHYIGFSYSKSPGYTHYRIRTVIFEYGIVKEVRGYFYVD